MKWHKAFIIDKNGAKHIIPDAVQSPEGYRVIRQKLGVDIYRYSAWQPAPELAAPHLKLLAICSTSEEAKAACESHLREQSNKAV
jgi:hypothetical protein